MKLPGSAACASTNALVNRKIGSQGLAPQACFRWLVPADLTRWGLVVSHARDHDGDVVLPTAFQGEIQ